MMRYIRLFVVLFCLFLTAPAFSQISHGGTPYFLQPSVLRASAGSFFIEMPAFNRDSVLMEDAINEENMLRSFKFAHKFHTRIDSKDAFQTILPDGTTVRQIGIRSAGAYSINLLLSDFEIPPGGKLFIYNADHSYIVGSFDYRNNSPDKILPIQPVAGESIIIEYSEPANVPFTGRFIITEVNHDYRDIFKKGPDVDKKDVYDCMPDVFCKDAAEEIIRSTILLIINGNTACTGSLLNNTSDDGKPYLLTANHCLCSPASYPQPMSFYEGRAKTIVAFFNYNRPVCDSTLKMKGSEEMILTGTKPRVILESRDIAFLEFNELPQSHYNAYYAGWKLDLTATGNTHINLHHPSGAVKKYGKTNESLSMVSYPSASFLDANSFWKVPKWTTGSTHEGSSGSPLFDENLYIIGGLTGGASECVEKSPNGKPDYFFALGKSWEMADPAGNKLKNYLNPENKEVSQYPGMDPNRNFPVVRLTNAQYNKGDRLIKSEFELPNKGFVFGNSNLNTLEFAEEFNLPHHSIEIFGTFLLLPAMDYSNTSKVKISVYTGNSSPETKIYTTDFLSQFVKDKNLTVPTETFVLFDPPVSVTGKFFISYSIESTTTQFCVYNTKHIDSASPGTAWLKDETKGWVTADEYEYQPMKTSLAIHPLIRILDNNKIETVKVQEKSVFSFNRSDRTLSLFEPLGLRGQIFVYSTGGQLLEKIQVQQGQKEIILHERPKGMIGVVKISSDTFFHSGKIIY